MSAQFVLIGHGILIFGLAPKFGEPNSPYLQELGVVVFFVLSGFVITHSTRLKAKRPDSKFGIASYIGDRFSRIYTVYGPALVFVLLMTLIFDRLIGTSQVSGTQFFGNLFMLQSHPLFRSGDISTLLGTNLPHIGAFGLGRPFWSIAVEWWFYLTFGALYFAVIRWKTLGTGNRLITIAGIAFSLLVPWQQFLGEHRALVLAWFLGSMMSFALPTVSRWAARFPRSTAISGLVLTFGSALPLYIQHSGSYNLTFTLLLSFGVFTTLASLQNYDSTRFSKPASVFADYSYSLYALHYPVIMLAWALHFNTWLGFFCVFIIANVGSYFFAQFFEKRNKQFRAFMHRFAAKN